MTQGTVGQGQVGQGRVRQGPVRRTSRRCIMSMSGHMARLTTGTDVRHMSDMSDVSGGEQRGRQ